MTRRAGKLTPELKVLVATITRNELFLKPFSMISRSSKVSPAWWNATPYDIVFSKTESSPAGEFFKCVFKSWMFRISIWLLSFSPSGLLVLPNLYMSSAIWNDNFSHHSLEGQKIIAADPSAMVSIHSWPTFSWSFCPAYMSLLSALMERSRTSSLSYISVPISDIQMK